MPVKLIMPKIGLNMVEGQINEWVVAEGQAVKKGDILYVVETDKVTNDIEAPQDGVIAKILIPAGEVVPVRAVVGILISEDESVDIDAFVGTIEGLKSYSAPEASDVIKTAAEKKAAEKPGGQILASPFTKRLAAEKCIDLETISGTGPGGRITTEDVKNAIAGAGNGGISLPGKIVPVKGVRKVIAERLSRANAEIPMVTLYSKIDVSTLVAYREELKREGKEKAEIPGYNAILAFLTAKALREFPYLNASWTLDGIKLIDPINIGVAVDTEDGLRVVVLRGVEKKSVGDIHVELNAITQKAVEGRNNPEELIGGTFTITNLGMFGVDAFTPIINPPEAGILGVGRFIEEEDGFSSTFSLVFDHRIIDGAPAARFLSRLGVLIADYQ